MSKNTSNSKNSKKPFYRRWWYPLLLILLFLGTIASINEPAMFMVGLVVFILLLILVIVGVSREKKSAKLETAAAAQKKAVEQAAVDQSEAERSAQEVRKEEEYQRLADQIAMKTFPVAGVTFKNDDRTSRQKILKTIFKEEDGTANATLEEFEYEGEPAIRVLADGGCVGNIRRSDVKEVLSIIERQRWINLSVEDFEDDDDKIIYRADVVIGYYK